MATGYTPFSSFFLISITSLAHPFTPSLNQSIQATIVHSSHTIAATRSSIMKHLSLLLISSLILLCSSTFANPISSSARINPSPCTYTTYKEPVYTHGPTSTYFPITSTTAQGYDCQGCNYINVIPLGHAFYVSSYYDESCRANLPHSRPSTPPP